MKNKQTNNTDLEPIVSDVIDNINISEEKIKNLMNYINQSQEKFIECNKVKEFLI